MAVSTPHLLTSLVEEAVSVGTLVRLLSFERGRASLIEVTLAADAKAANRDIVELDFPIAPEDPPAMPIITGMIGGGTLEIEEAGMGTGDPVVGQVTGIVYEPLF